mmetsp:Transcript_83120/g.217039  ORF Transcript_83120/g.217039 Transcript_83120/m.217039 type:complete len:315 (-) Transcript_83120:12-956(-)
MPTVAQKFKPHRARTLDRPPPSVEAAREEHSTELRGALVKNHHGHKLPEDTPGCASPEGRHAALLHQDCVGLPHGAELRALDVALHARLKGIWRMAQHGADRATNQGSTEASRILRLTDAVWEIHLKACTQHRHQTQEATTVDAFTQANPKRASHHSRGSAGNQAAGGADERATLALLLDHGQLNGAADEAREVARAKGGPYLLHPRQGPVLAPHDELLQDSGAGELEHDTAGVVQTVRGVAAIEHFRIGLERQALLSRVLPVVCGLQQCNVQPTTHRTKRRVLHLGEVLGHGGARSNSDTRARAQEPFWPTKP